MQRIELVLDRVCKAGLFLFNNLLNQALLLEGEGLSLQASPSQLFLLSFDRSGLMVTGISTLFFKVGDIKHVHVHQAIILLVCEHRFALIALNSVEALPIVSNQFVLNLCFQLFEAVLDLHLELSGCIFYVVQSCCVC